jgi:hypothetical protein
MPPPGFSKSKSMAFIEFPIWQPTRPRERPTNSVRTVSRRVLSWHTANVRTFARCQLFRRKTLLCRQSPPRHRLCGMSIYLRRGLIMWNWFNCRVSGRHDFAMSSESGAVFLCCAHCGRRSSGWSLETKARKPVADAARAKSEPRGTSAPGLSMAAPAVRILPFAREQGGPSLPSMAAAAGRILPFAPERRVRRVRPAA